MGSKRLIGKYILPIMLKERQPDQWWVEPFVGGGNLIDKVTGKRIGSDSNRYVIEALRAIRDCPLSLPKNNKEFTKHDYEKLKESDDYPFKGYAAFAFSFGGCQGGGWAHCSKNIDYVRAAFNSAQKQSPLLKDVVLVLSDYREVDIPPKSLIYCDPPYLGKQKYRVKFDHTVFWEWCRKKREEGHTLFISESEAPSDFTCVWEKEIRCVLRKGLSTKRLERLFTI